MATELEIFAKAVTAVAIENINRMEVAVFEAAAKLVESLPAETTPAESAAHIREFAAKLVAGRQARRD